MRDSTFRLIVGGLTFLLCLAVGGGHFHAIDEGSMYVTAVNVVTRGDIHTNQLGWSQWANRPGEEVGFVTEAGDVYSKKSPLVIALMIPLVALGLAVPALGTYNAVLLLGPVGTALTAGVLYSFARELGYSRRVSSFAVAVFVLGTMTLVYSKLAMGEPVASLGLLVAVRAAVAAQTGSAYRNALLCGVGVVGAIGATAVYAAFVPLFAVVLFLAGRRVFSFRERVLRVAAFGLPVLALGLALMAYNSVRFGDPLETGYHFAPGQEGFTTPLWWGVLGLMISPARGFLWYNPPAFLGLAGWPRLHRAAPVLSWVMSAVVAGHLLLFGKWWGWWGGYAWGPRFLLPIVPYFVLAALPVLESPGRIARVATGVIFAAGLAVQIAGVALDPNAYEGELDAKFPAPSGQPLLYHHAPALVYDVAGSPIVVHFQRLFTSDLDFAWWPGRGRRPDLPETIAAIRSNARGGDAIVFLAPELTDALMAAPDLPPTFGLPVNVAEADTLAARLFARALRGARRVWLLTWYGPADPGNWYERQLRETWASVREAPLDGYRVMLFARPPVNAARFPSGFTFSTLRLAAYSAARQADTLFVEFAWTAVETPPDNYVTFVHVLSPDGVLIAGQDRQPLGGYRPTAAWRAGDTVVDRFAFGLTPDQSRGASLEVGWYFWPSLERLPVADPSGRRIEGDSLVVAIEP